MTKPVTKREFLKTSGKVAAGAAIGVVGLNTLKGNQLFGQEEQFPWPWQYAILDPDQARVLAHKYYWSGYGCCSGVFGGVVDLLKVAVGNPWNYMPIQAMLFGRGGGVSWGTLCGAINGGAAVISLCVPAADQVGLINELWGWYCSENLPSDVANSFATEGKYEMHKYDEALPQNISGSPLCHVSVSQWCLIAGNKVGDIERQERCARITGDIAAKTVELLNAYLNKQFTPTFQDSDEVKACLACHGPSGSNNVMTHMECGDCHSDAHAGVIEKNGGFPSGSKISQNYPNPFIGSTKIGISVPKAEHVQVEISDIKGNVVAVLVNNELLDRGDYTLTWDGTDYSGKALPGGTYFARMVTSGYMKTIKMVMVQ